MADRVKFTAFDQQHVMNDPKSYILVDGEEVGDIVKASAYISEGFDKSTKVVDYTVSFWDDRYDHVKTRVFVIESDPRQFLRVVRRMAVAAMNRDPNEPFTYVGPFRTAREGLAAAKEFVRSVVRGEV